MSDLLEAVLADLSAEGDRLDALVADRPDADWRTPTPAAGWDVATQIAHLAWTDEVAVSAAGAISGSKDAWDALVLEALGDPEHYVDRCAEEGAQVAPADLLVRWRTARPALATALRAVTSGQKVPWFGPPMSPVSMATARFMETWAHALDVADAFGEVLEPTDRMRHVAHLGIRTRNFSFATHGLAVPGEEFGVTLVSPSEDVWSWGPPEAAQTVTGSAYDFCLLVTQRRHRHDLDLVASGPDADRWLDIAQAFAGPPGAGRRPDGSEARRG